MPAVGSPLALSTAKRRARLDRGGLAQQSERTTMLTLYVAAVGLKHSLLAGLRRLHGDNTGVTAIEYGLIAGAIAIAIIAAVIAVGGDVKGLFNTTDTQLKSLG
jgi:pilus assembly protein Flp/PilA